MPSDNSLIYATILFTIGFGFTIWINWVSLFKPTQWLTPVKKTILITGCDSGIGFELARYFHAKGSIIIATVVSKQSKGAQKLLELGHKDQNLFIVEADYKEYKLTKAAVDDIKRIIEINQLKLHAVVNNAGICVFSEFDFCTDEQIDNQLTVNLFGTIRFTKLLLPIIIQNQSRIVNVTSVNTFQAFPGIAVYVATKRGLEGFADSLRMELAKFNVKVINIRLGDYAKLTDIMKGHSQVVEAQKKVCDSEKQQRYSNDYFEKLHWTALNNYGMFSPPSYEKSPLFGNFEEALLAVKPANYITSATFTYKLILFFLASLPVRLSDYIINFFYNKSILDAPL